MYPHYLSESIYNFQDDLFYDVNKDSDQVGVLVGTSVAVIDVAAYVSTPFFDSVLAVVNCAIDILGTGFNNSAMLRSMVNALDSDLSEELEMYFEVCSMERALKDLNFSSERFFAGFGRALTSPVSLVYQIGSLILAPENATSLSAYY